LFVFDGIASTSNVNVKQLDVYPTITNESISIVLPDGLNAINGLEVSIFNYAGQLEFMANINGQEINVSGLSAGTYLGMIKVKDERYRFQFVKQ
jgi:hypothetical protein